jgi:uncharacterized membrane-anchored protein
MSAVLTGNIYEHRRTKELLHYIPDQAIALIWHQDLDGMAVEGFLKRKVKAVINGMASMTGQYRHDNITKLMDEGIPVYDIKSIHQTWETLYGEQVILYGEELYIKKNGQFSHYATVQCYTETIVNQLLNEATKAYPRQLQSFVENTLEFAKKECSYFLTEPILPPGIKKINGHDVLIVARSPSYEADLKAVRAMLKRNHVKILAIDGAADGLLRVNVKPDFIIGDMDSVSAKSLSCGATLLCHQNINGSSPGKERLRHLGIEAETITFVGTSEDVAIHAAFWSGATHLYLIGCRISLHEFLEKGRAGMGASLLNRIQAGERMTDLKGIHRLSQPAWTFGKVTRHFIKRFEKVMILPMLQSSIIERMNLWKKKEAVRHE